MIIKRLEKKDINNALMLYQDIKMNSYTLWDDDYPSKELIEWDIERNGLLKGLGKPEPLKYRKMCSRRITEEHRLTYNFDQNKNLIIYSCKGHYED